jgi:phospholipase/carboxylesterase
MSELEALAHVLRPAAGAPAGALVLLHGRGVDERDLAPLLDALDPERRLVGAAPRGPLSLPPGGRHWYVVPRVGFPDPDTFQATLGRLDRWLAALAATTGVPPARTVLGGFSQGAVMAYALGLGVGRPRPAGVLALSGFLPSVPGFALDLDSRAGLPVAIAHGEHDPIIPVALGHNAARRLAAAGLEVTYRESPIPHAVDPAVLPELRGWLARTVPAGVPAG